MRPPINSEKHIHPRSLSTVAENTATTFQVVIADADATLSNQVRVGAVVKAVYCEIWVIGSSAQPVFQILTIEKISSGGPQPTSAQMSALHNYPNKKNILFTSQGLVGDSNSNPIPLYRDWIKIPKGKQRFGLGDSLVFTIAARGEANNDVEVCGIFIFKEYY